MGSARDNRPEYEAERGPAWLVWPGVALLVVILLFAVFSLGVYMGEREMTRPVVPPWPEPRASSTVAPTLPPLATYPLSTPSIR
jgi:cytochrome c-type biogenesis protein CcmH/NrfG